MKSIGIYEAKSKLSELVEKAEAGEVVTITRRGRPVAKLVRARAEPAIDRITLFKEIDALRKTIRPKRKFSIRTLIEEGRR